MTDQAHAIYVFIDNLLKLLNHQEDKKRKFSDAELLTTAIVAAYHFGGNIDRTRSFMLGAKITTYMLDKSRFNRRLHALGEKLTLLFLQIGEHIKEVASCQRFILDSFPIPVCDNIRIIRSKIVQGKEYRGWQASMRRYFYGIKVQLITTESGIPVEILPSTWRPSRCKRLTSAASLT